MTLRKIEIEKNEDEPGYTIVGVGSNGEKVEKAKIYLEDHDHVKEIAFLMCLLIKQPKEKSLI